ncbi:hypothetical protein K1719_044479 [Acacia pycnantha]|nr:hypothetical protein K1719_046512 [Acacia pycnantha]KAI9073575.1 hypothetical protein K1719_044479 [Acacia pycnantha]
MYKTVLPTQKKTEHDCQPFSNLRLSWPQKEDRERKFLLQTQGTGCGGTQKKRYQKQSQIFCDFRYRTMVRLIHPFELLQGGHDNYLG